MSRIRGLLVVCVALAALAAPVSSHATATVIQGVGFGDTSCDGNAASFTGVRQGGSTWTFTFTTVTDGNCLVEAGAVTGTWSPGGATPTCVSPGEGPDVGIFCLASVPASTIGNPTSIVAFSACGLIFCVVGDAEVAKA